MPSGTLRARISAGRSTTSTYANKTLPRNSTGSGESTTGPSGSPPQRLKSLVDDFVPDSGLDEAFRGLGFPAQGGGDGEEGTEPGTATPDTSATNPKGNAKPSVAAAAPVAVPPPVSATRGACLQEWKAPQFEDSRNYKR